MAGRYAGRSEQQEQKVDRLRYLAHGFRTGDLLLPKRGPDVAQRMCRPFACLQVPPGQVSALSILEGSPVRLATDNHI